MSKEKPSEVTPQADEVFLENLPQDCLFQDTKESNTYSGYGQDRTMLVVAFGVVLLAFLLQVRDDHEVAFARLTDYPTPHLCMTQSLFGIDCPGCGLTRSFIHLAHCNWRASLETHRLGWVMAIAVLLQFPYRIQKMRGGDGMPLGSWFPRWFGYTLIFLLIANWVCNLLWQTT